MEEWLRQLTPPEWGEWNLWGRLAYIVVFAGIMAVVYGLARWAIY